MLENALHAALRKQVTTGWLSVTYPSGRIEQYGDGGGPPVAVRFADPNALRAVALDPGLAVAEMYMDGRLLLDVGDVYDLIALFKRATRPELATPGARLQHLRRSITDAPVLRAIGLKSARSNVAHHYDLDERLYRLFLDDDMQYSCAWFQEPGMGLDAAQLAKKRLIAAKLLVRPGARVLDIGCGWGGLALYLARVCGARVTGITLSQEQLRVAAARVAAAGLGDRIEFRFQDYREIEGEFDNIVSVGMFEHVGLRQYPVFFRTASRLLAPDGVMLLHSMAQPRPAHYNQPFIEKYIFPGGYIPALSEVLPQAEAAQLLIRDTEILALHYAETTRAWRERFLANRERVLALYDERFIRMWEFYLAGSEAAFRFDRLHVFHLQLAHEQGRVPLTRDYIPPEMARLAEEERAFADYARLHAGPALAPALRSRTS
jgi:cyclopropane-fatty-acyl-phospholipid synthase